MAWALDVSSHFHVAFWSRVRVSEPCTDPHLPTDEFESQSHVQTSIVHLTSSSNSGRKNVEVPWICSRINLRHQRRNWKQLACRERLDAVLMIGAETEHDMSGMSNSLPLCNGIRPAQRKYSTRLGTCSRPSPGTVRTELQLLLTKSPCREHKEGTLSSRRRIVLRRSQHQQPQTAFTQRVGHVQSLHTVRETHLRTTLVSVCHEDIDNRWSLHRRPKLFNAYSPTRACANAVSQCRPAQIKDQRT